MALNNINLSILKLSALITSTTTAASPSLGCLSSSTIYRVFNSAQISYNPYLYSPSMNYHTAETTLGMAEVLFSGTGEEEAKKRIVEFTTSQLMHSEGKVGMDIEETGRR